MRVELPQATPETYLRWVRRWRDVERAPALRAGGWTQGPPALHKVVAEFIVDTLAPQILMQARRARRDGYSFVAPLVDGDRELLHLALDAMERHGRWLAWGARQERAAAAAGVAYPEAEVRALQHRAMERLRNQLTGERRDFTGPRASWCPNCGSTDVVVLATAVNGSPFSLTACNRCNGQPWTVAPPETLRRAIIARTS
jgi:hypothetical protein